MAWLFSHNHHHLINTDHVSHLSIEYRPTRVVAHTTDGQDFLVYTNRDPRACLEWLRTRAYGLSEGYIIDC